MSAAAPWSVKGIDPKAREVAKDLARRSGMTLGEWLNSMIMEDEDEGYATLPRRTHAADSFERRGRSRRIDDLYVNDESIHRIGASVEVIAGRLEAAERRSTLAIQGVDQAVEGVMRRLDGADEAGQATARRIDDIAEELREGHRRLRAFEQKTGPQIQEAFGKLETGVGALAGRMYDIEERQRLGVNDLRQRMEAVEKAAGQAAASPAAPGFSAAAGEALSRRLDAAERAGAATGPDILAQVGTRLDAAQGRTAEALRRLEQTFAGLDQRLRTAEGRIEPEGAREAARFEKLAETLSRQVEASRAEMLRRMDTAQSENRLDRLEQALAVVGDQIKASEARSAQAVEAMGREVLRIAQNLSGRMGRVERAQAEARAAGGVDAGELDRLGRELSGRLDRDVARRMQAIDERLDQRLTRAEDQHALALEKLGGEITRISDRLADRITQSERRSQQAIEDIGRRLADASDRVEQRHTRASGELAERLRLSEDRTARLLDEARDAMEQRAAAPVPSLGLAPPAAPAQSPAPPPAPVADAAPSGDWRAAAFPDDGFDLSAPDAWLAAAAAAPSEATSPETAWSDELDRAAPFPTTFTAAPDVVPSDAGSGEDVVRPSFEAGPSSAAADEGASSETDPVDARPPEPAFGGFGGAEVGDALAATARPAPPAEIGLDDFDAETDFVDPRELRAAAARGRAASTRSTIEAARAAIAGAEETAAAPPKAGFSLLRPGKSRLQERLDRQAAKDGGTVKKALVASVTAVALTGGLFALVRYGDPIGLPGQDGTAAQAPAPTTLALAATAPAATTTADAAAAQGLYDEATAALDAGRAEGLTPLTRAANLGFAPAQLKLSSLYQEGGPGVEADAAESRLWARRAAEGGDPTGMHNYAMALFEGEGGPRDRPQALTWLRRAAERGLVDSQYNVARLYENGDDGIAADPAEALKWYTIAARAGDQQARSAAERLGLASTAAERLAARRAADAFQLGARTGDA